MGGTPNFAALDQAEAQAVRAALERGYLSTDALREALLLREQLRLSGRPTRLLQLLGRFIAEPHQVELRGLYFAALASARGAGGGLEPPTEPAPARAPAGDASLASAEAMLFSSDDELAIPELMLQQSSEQLARPPSEDPAPVREYLQQRSQEIAPRDGEPAEVTESGLWRWLKRQLPG